MKTAVILLQFVVRRIIPFMDDPEKPRVWWDGSQEKPRRIAAIASIIALGLAILILHPDIRSFLSTHPWWQSLFAALPGIGMLILAYFELHHSGEANALRIEANDLRAKANNLQTQANTQQGQIAKLTAELNTERNKHLQQIAKNTEKPVTEAERNANTLRKHLRANVTVTEEHGDWGSITPEIAEVSDENIVTLFTPRGYASSTAWCVKVHCGQLEIVDFPQGSCPLRLKVLKRYGPTVQLGEITKWEDRLQPAATPTFAKGGAVFYREYVKPGSSDTRSLYVYESSDGTNLFSLEGSTGQAVRGDNLEISKMCMVMQVEYEAAGFRQSRGSGSSSHKYPLFVK